MFFTPPPIVDIAPKMHMPVSTARRAEAAVICAEAKGAKVDKLAVYDADMPASKKRFWLLDLSRSEPTLILHDYVAHGAGSDPKKTGWAKRFSNVIESGMTSLGLYRIAEGYEGHAGWSWRLDGLTPGFNSNARERAVVLHPARYVTEDGAIGRSLGCPAVSQVTADKMRSVGLKNAMLWIDSSDQGLEKSQSLTCSKAQQWMASVQPGADFITGASVEVAAPVWAMDPSDIWGL